MLDNAAAASDNERLMFAIRSEAQLIDPTSWTCRRITRCPTKRGTGCPQPGARDATVRQMLHHAGNNMTRQQCGDAPYTPVGIPTPIPLLSQRAPTTITPC